MVLIIFHGVRLTHYLA